MSSFYYKSTKYFDGEPRLAVKCDVCGKVLYTDREGQSFPEHITVCARNNGWKHIKRNGKWIDKCDECLSYEQMQKRKAYYKYGEAE